MCLNPHNATESDHGSAIDKCDPLLDVYRPWSVCFCTQNCSICNHNPKHTRERNWTHARGAPNHPNILAALCPPPSHVRQQGLYCATFPWKRHRDDIISIALRGSISDPRGTRKHLSVPSAFSCCYSGCRLSSSYHSLWHAFSSSSWSGHPPYMPNVYACLFLILHSYLMIATCSWKARNSCFSHLRLLRIRPSPFLWRSSVRSHNDEDCCSQKGEWAYTYMISNYHQPIAFGAVFSRIN